MSTTTDTTSKPSPPSSLTRSFLIGAAVSFFPMIYIGLYYNRLSCSDAKNLSISYPSLVVLLPLFYGLVYVILNNILKPIKDRKVRLLILGALAGEIYSLFGHFSLHLPENLFKLDNPNSVHLFTPLLYSAIYGIFVDYLESNV